MSIIIGIDHGYYAIKTAHCSFPAGLTSYGEHEPYTRQGLLEFGGCFFVCGSGRQPIQRDKTVNDNYYLLTLAAIAKEIHQRGLPPECSVRIAAGLPLTSFGRDKPKFKDYLLRSKPSYLLFENVPGLLSHDGGRTFATILNTLDRLGYGVEWQCLNSKDFGVPQSRNRVYIVGYLDERCRGKVFPFTETAGSSLIQTHGGHQGERVYSPEGLSCTLAANPGGFGGKTGLYEVGVPIKCATKTGYQMAQVGDSIDLSYATVNSRRGRIGKEIAHTLTTGCQQGTVEVRPVKNPIKSDLARNTERTGKPGAPMHTLTTKDRHGVLYEGRIRRLTLRECLRLQGWADDRIDTVLAIQSDNQAYKQAGNGVTVHVVEVIGRRIAAMDAELRGEALAP